MAVLDGVEAESIVVKFFGIFFFFFQCNSIVGHIISTGGKKKKCGGQVVLSAHVARTAVSDIWCG
jgi:hypothetical protein